MLGQRFGHAARRAVLGDLAAGRFAVASLERDDYATVVGLETRYADLQLGMADCSVMILADRYQTNRILSFEERHFRSITSLGGAPFVVLPVDTVHRSL